MGDFIYIKNSQEIEKIRSACNIFKLVRDTCLATNLLNKSLKEIDEFLRDLILEQKATCAFHQYQGFPGYNCISKNKVIIHGIGTENDLFNPDDKITLDIGIKYDGYICDAAFTILGPAASAEYQKINEVTKEAINVACEVIKPGNQVGDISFAIERYVKSHNYQLLRNYGGHGCGIKIHEGPLILNYGSAHTGHKLKAGMILCIEPMVLASSHEAYLGADGWSVISKKDQPVCHWEHMVLVTDTGCEVLTK